MKHVVSISLGSSRRDHSAQHEFGGQTFLIERIGTDGDKAKAIELIRGLDGKVDAFGMGGTDLYIYAGNRRYTFRESAQIAAAAKITPIVDGSGIKNTLERKVIDYLAKQKNIQFKDKKVLMVCAVDRFGMAEAMAGAGCRLVMGDLMFGLHLPIPIHTLKGLARLACWVAPVITRLPIDWFYPTGSKQNQFQPRFTTYFDQADIIAGDFHFIRRFMPESINGKLIITNTVTQDDVELLTKRGAQMLVTTTPEMAGRSFGTNTLEAVLVALSGKRPEQLSREDYAQILEQIGVEPRVQPLQTGRGE